MNTFWFRLAWFELWRNRTRTLLSIIGLAAGIAVLTSIIALGVGMRVHVLKEVVREIPVDLVEVVPRRLALGMFELSTGSLLGGSKLDANTVRSIEALAMVRDVYPTRDIALPLGVQGGQRLIGKSVYMDVVANGVDERLLGDNIVASQLHAVPGAFDVPVIISPQLLTMFNHSVAPALGVPRLSSDALVGLGFDLTVGQSIVLGQRGARGVGRTSARIVGMSPFAMRLGITLPLKVAEKLLAQYSSDPKLPTHYASLWVRATSADQLPKLLKVLQSMGLSVDDSAERLARVISMGTFLASLLGVLVLLMSVQHIFYSFVVALMERRHALGIFRALGARRGQILASVLLHAAILGFLGGVLGLVLGRLCGMAVDGVVLSWFDDFPFHPTSLFAFTWARDTLLLAVAMLAALGGALGPALAATRMGLQRALAQD